MSVNMQKRKAVQWSSYKPYFLEVILEAVMLITKKNDCGDNFNESEALLVSHRSAITSSSNNEKTASSSAMMCSLDRGKYVENRLVLPDDIKHDLLVKQWQPSSSYQFPKYA